MPDSIDAIALRIARALCEQYTRDEAVNADQQAISDAAWDMHQGDWKKARIEWIATLLRKWAAEQPCPACDNGIPRKGHVGDLCVMQYVRMAGGLYYAKCGVCGKEWKEAEAGQ